MTKFFNISTDELLGGAHAAHDIVPSQKSVKTYTDTEIARLLAKYSIQPITSTNASFTFDTLGPTYYISDISDGITNIDITISFEMNNTNYILLVNKGQQQVNVAVRQILLNGSAVNKSYCPILVVNAKSATLLTIHAGNDARNSFAVIEQSENLLIHAT